jgi:hypothetical protein
MKSPYFNALCWRLRMRGKSPGSGGLMGLCGADMDPICCGHAGLEEDPLSELSRGDLEALSDAC